MNDFTNARLITRLNVGDVICLGPADSYSGIVSRTAGRTLFFVKSVSDVLPALMQGGADYCILPFENSTGGSVQGTFPALMDSDIEICAEFRLPIQNVLISSKDITDKNDLTHVASHPQALLQCSKAIAELDFQTVPRGSTGESAEYIVAKRYYGAIAHESALQYGQHVLERNFQNDPDNRTRFLLLKRSDGVSAKKVIVKSTPSRQFRVMFAAYKPSSVNRCRYVLSDVSELISKHHIKVRTINSVPIKQKYGHFFELYSNSEVGVLFDKLNEMPDLKLKWFGQYPVIYLDQNGQPVER